MGNLSLSSCLKIFRQLDYNMYSYLRRHKASEVNMLEVSNYALNLQRSN